MADDFDEEAYDRKLRQRPYWVRLTLYGASYRGAAIVYFILCLLAGLCGAIGALWHPLWLVVAATGWVCALPYFFAIRWVDKYGEWP